MGFRAMFIALATGSAAILCAQAPPPASAAGQEGWRKAGDAAPGEYVIEPGTRIPLNLLNSVSTKHSAEGDRVYLQTVFPVLLRGRIVIPPGSYVAGTITRVKRPGRVKGRGEPLPPLRLPDLAKRRHPRFPRANRRARWPRQRGTR